MLIISKQQVNNILNRKRSCQHVSQLMIDDVLTSDKKKIANAFNKYFTNVANDLCKKIPKTNNEFQDFLKNPMNTPFSQ